MMITSSISISYIKLLKKNFFFFFYPTWSNRRITEKFGNVCVCLLYKNDNLLQYLCPSQCYFILFYFILTSQKKTVYGIIPWHYHKKNNISSTKATNWTVVSNHIHTVSYIMNIAVITKSIWRQSINLLFFIFGPYIKVGFIFF